MEGPHDPQHPGQDAAANVLHAIHLEGLVAYVERLIIILPQHPFPLPILQRDK